MASMESHQGFTFVSGDGLLGEEYASVRQAKNWTGDEIAAVKGGPGHDSGATRRARNY